MFTKITLHNFRSFKHIEFDLRNKNGSPKKLVMLYGENGSGKSNLLSAFVLLSELFKTFDVKELYERLLNQESIFSNADVDKTIKQKMVNELRDIKKIINDYRMIDCNENIVVEYEFMINNNVGNYYIEFDESEIVCEKLEFLLNKRRGVFFECNARSISINSGLVNDKDLFDDIRASSKRYWGKHSMLSIILRELEEKSESFGWNNINGNFLDVLSKFRLISEHIDIDSRSWNGLIVPYEVFENAIEGRIHINDEKQLDISEDIFTAFFSSINSNISKAYYKRTYVDKYIHYNLYLEKIISGAKRNINFSRESTGNHQLLKVLCFLICACCGRIVVFDEADSGIHDVLFQKIMNDIYPMINGQLIISTHNTMLMETCFARNAVHVIYEDDNDIVVRPVNNYDKRTYIKNNIRNKYLSGEYKGVPTVQNVNFSHILDLFNDGLKIN